MGIFDDLRKNYREAVKRRRAMHQPTPTGADLPAEAEQDAAFDQIATFRPDEQAREQARQDLSKSAELPPFSGMSAAPHHGLAHPPEPMVPGLAPQPEHDDGMARTLANARAEDARLKAKIGDAKHGPAGTQALEEAMAEGAARASGMATLAAADRIASEKRAAADRIAGEARAAADKLAARRTVPPAPHAPATTPHTPAARTPAPHTTPGPAAAQEHAPTPVPTTPRDNLAIFLQAKRSTPTPPEPAPEHGPDSHAGIGEAGGDAQEEGGAQQDKRRDEPREQQPAQQAEAAAPFPAPHAEREESRPDQAKDGADPKTEVKDKAEAGRGAAGATPAAEGSGRQDKREQPAGHQPQAAQQSRMQDQQRQAADALHQQAAQRTPPVDPFLATIAALQGGQQTPQQAQAQGLYLGAAPAQRQPSHSSPPTTIPQPKAPEAARGHLEMPWPETKAAERAGEAAAAGVAVHAAERAAPAPQVDATPAHKAPEVEAPQGFLEMPKPEVQTDTPQPEAPEQPDQAQQPEITEHREAQADAQAARDQMQADLQPLPEPEAPQPEATLAREESDHEEPEPEPEAAPEYDGYDYDDYGR